MDLLSVKTPGMAERGLMRGGIGGKRGETAGNCWKGLICRAGSRM